MGAALAALPDAPSEARRLLDRVDPLLPAAAPATRLAAGLVAFEARRYARALDHLAAVGRSGHPLATGALTQAASLAAQLGWTHQALELLTARQALQPAHVGTRQKMADLLAQTRNYEAAAAVLAAGPTGRRGALLHAEMLLALGDPGAARAIDAVEAAVEDPLVLAGLLGRSGAPDRAADVLARAPQTQDTRAARALCLLRAGRFGAALEASQDDPTSLMVRGAALLAAGPPLYAVGRSAEALLLLDAAILAQPQGGEARLWRAEARLRLGDEAGALEDIDRGVLLSGGYVLGARLMRYLLEVRAARRSTLGGVVTRVLEPLAPLIPGRSARRINAGILEELGPGLRSLGLSGATLATLAERSGVERVLPDVIVRLGGDRSPRGPDSPRAQARRTLELIRSAPPAAVLARFAALNDALGPSSMGVVHQGELRLWMGDWAGAIADFGEALRRNRHTRWGWIGQLGSEAVGGDPERALAVGARGVEVMGGYGPSHYVYRAEALWRLDRHAEARADLEEAVGLNPTRIGAWLTLAVVTAEQGDGARLTDVLEHLVPRVAPMLSMAAQATGTPLETIWRDDGSLGSDRAALLPVLRAARVMMRGNRSSSCLTWFAPDGSLRLTHRPRPSGNDPSRTGSDVRRRRAAQLLALSAASPR